MAKVFQGSRRESYRTHRSLKFVRLLALMWVGAN